MDGRQILDGMNDDVIFGIYNGQAPWQCDVPEGMLRRGSGLGSSGYDSAGLAFLQLGCLENRFGYAGQTWTEKKFADGHNLKLEDDVRCFSSLELNLFHGRDGQMASMSGRPVFIYNDDHEVDTPLADRYVSWPNLNENLTAPIFNQLCDERGIDREDALAMRAGIFDLVTRTNRTYQAAFSFGTADDQGNAICRNLMAQSISSWCGYGWRADEAVQVDPNMVASAVKQDPFWLARVCCEAEIRRDWLLHPESSKKAFGSIENCRAAYEEFFGSLKQEEKRQYLVVPFEDNAEVKAKGGRFDRVAKAWYVPSSADINDFAKWDRPSEMPPEAVAETMRHHGLLSRATVMDGAPHRVMLEGQRPGASPAGSYTGYLDGRPAGHFTNFRDGDGKAVKWVASGHRVDPELRSATAREIEAKRDARRRELAAKREEAAAKAGAEWNMGSFFLDGAPQWPDESGHQYLEAKGVGNYGLRVNR